VTYCTDEEAAKALANPNHTVEVRKNGCMHSMLLMKFIYMFVQGRACIASLASAGAKKTTTTTSSTPASNNVAAAYGYGATTWDPNAAAAYAVYIYIYVYICITP
jgi:hypothetical protein